MNGNNRAQRRLAAKQTPRHVTRVLHALIDTWLEGTDLGRHVVETSSHSIPEARQAILELQRHGFLRVEVTDGDPLRIEIIPCFPEEGMIPLIS